MSILDNRPALKAAVDQVAEVAGYLWQKGWAERNGGNITINITEYVDEAMKALPAIDAPRSIGKTLPHLKGCWFYCKGTGKRMRDLAREPMANGSIIRILEDCARYEIVADAVVAPTSELPSHLAVHDYPETKAFCPRGLGMVPYLLPSSVELADATLKTLDEGYDVVMWEKHGVFAVDTDIMSAFDQVDVLNKSALIYIAAKNMGFEPEGMSEAQMKEMSVAFNLPK